jgi:RHS repeat-associated protein
MITVGPSFSAGKAPFYQPTSAGTAFAVPFTGAGPGYSSLSTTQADGFPVTVTANSPTITTGSAHGLTVNTRVKFASNGSLPAPLSSSAEYFVRSVASTAFTLKTSLTSTVAITLTNAGSGLHYVSKILTGTILDSGFQYTPALNTAPKYDADGNLLEDGATLNAQGVVTNTNGRFSYTWDGENRLKTILWSNPGGGRSRITYTYDGYSRRVLKRHEQQAPLSAGWYVVDYLGFIYDAWNHIMTVRLNEDHTARGRVASYVWGPDIGSGFGQYAKRQRAGGVGGLCMVLDGASVGAAYPDFISSTAPDPADDDYFPLMDRMGNVTGYRKAAAAEPANTLAATYDYDAFGQEIRCAGPASDSQPYRFSTKFTEGATGLVYYGYRWYDAGKGRWLSRDPTEEGSRN